MTSTNSYEKHYLTNRRSINDEKYVLVLFKSDNTFIIKKKSNLHGVDENGIVNIKDRGKSYTGYCLFEGTKDEIENAAARLDKEMNTDLESDCEAVISNSKAKQHQPRQNSTTTTNSSNSNVETGRSSTAKSNSGQKKNNPGTQQQKIQSLASLNLHLSSTNYKTPPPTNVSIQNKRVQETFVEQSANSTGCVLRPIDNVEKSTKNIQPTKRISTFDDDSSEEEDDDDNDDDDGDEDESVEPVIYLDNSLPSTSTTNNQDDARQLKRIRSKTSTKTHGEKTAKRLFTDSPTSDDRGNHFLKKIILSIDDLNKDSYQSSKDLKSLVVLIEKIDKKLNVLYENQKKIQRALSKKKINVALNGGQFGDDNIIADDSPFKSTLIYVDSKGESIDLLQLYGVRTQMGRYVALVMDNIFTKQEITTISLEELLKDQRYSIVKEAVRSRFKLNHEMLSVEWPTLHECILQKRRNEMKKNKKDVANTSTVTISQATAEEHCDY